MCQVTSYIPYEISQELSCASHTMAIKLFIKIDKLSEKHSWEC